MVSHENSLFETAIQRRLTRNRNNSDNVKYSWLENTTTVNRRRSSLFETTKDEETRGFMAQLKDAPRFNSAKEILPHVTCYCDGQECIALLNTNLCTSTIKKDFANKLNGTEINRRRKNNATLHKAKISLGSTSILFPLCIVESDCDICLGVDFLRKMNACLNFQENCLLLSNDKIPFKSAKEILLSTL